MSFIDDLVRTLRMPLDFIRGKTSRARSIEGGFQGSVNRIRNLPREFKGELQYNKQVVADYGKRAKRAKSSAQSWGKNKPANGGQGNAQAADPAPQRIPKKRFGMGLFSKKKRCPGCNEKLDAKWDLCPYCGFGAPDGVDAGDARPRTMALDVGGGNHAGGGHPRTMALDSGGPSYNQGGGGKPRTMALDAQSVGGHAPQQARGNAQSSRLVAWIIPLDGPQGGQLLELRSNGVVGTAPDCDVVVNDPSVSGRHAEFTAQGGVFRVNDLGSTNGTFVNERRVQNAELIDNDVLRLGRTSFKFKST